MAIISGNAATCNSPSFAICSKQPQSHAIIVPWVICEITLFQVIASKEAHTTISIGEHIRWYIGIVNANKSCICAIFNLGLSPQGHTGMTSCDISE